MSSLRKWSVVGVSAVGLLAFLLALSFLVSRNRADAFMADRNIPVVLRRSRIVMFSENETSPSWAFYYEYKNIETGVTLCIRVSLFGRLIDDESLKYLERFYRRGQRTISPGSTHHS